MNELSVEEMEKLRERAERLAREGETLNTISVRGLRGRKVGLLGKVDDKEVYLMELRLNDKDFQETLRALGAPLPYKVSPPRAMATHFPKTKCEYINDCTDTSERCGECANNKAISYFEPKEED